jgi:hypothetical protein
MVAAQVRSDSLTAQLPQNPAALHTRVPSQTFCFIASAMVAAVTAAETGMFKGRHFDRSVILLCIRWYLAYNLSLRNLEEMMAERGVSVDHATIHRWVIRYSPEL